jgi:PIN domain nuclease of toxin-antitoxin system
MGSVNDITIDTHILLWYLDRDFNERLSSEALERIKRAEASGTIYVSMIVLIESLACIEKGLFNLSFNRLLAGIEESETYKIVPLDTEVLKFGVSIRGLSLHDRFILATAMRVNTVLVSKDRDILAKYGVHVVW